MTVLVFANGDVMQYEWIRPYLAGADVTIAANGGLRHLRRLAHVPDIVIGDLDSLPDEVGDGPQIIRYPAAKDETDLELALLHAVSHYDGRILVFGALGGRLDQTLANILLLAHPAFRGRRVQLMEEHQRAWLITADEPQALIQGQVGDKVSLIPLGGDVQLAETRGLRWPLREEMLLFGPARGVSNVMTGEEAEVTVKNGRLLCVHIQGEWGR